LPASALAQLRAASGQDYAFIDGAVARVPVHTPTPSRGFVAEGGAIPVGALIIAALGLKPKKAASITAITKELAAGLPLNVELSLQTLLSQDLGLAIDAVLLGSAAATPDAPAGLLAGVTRADDALFQRALTDFIETAVRITVVGHSLPAATVELDHLREQLLERIDHGRPTLAIRRGKSCA
jgi:hypothetical protein